MRALATGAAFALAFGVTVQSPSKPASSPPPSPPPAPKPAAEKPAAAKPAAAKPAAAKPAAPKTEPAKTTTTKTAATKPAAKTEPAKTADTKKAPEEAPPPKAKPTVDELKKQTETNLRKIEKSLDYNDVNKTRITMAEGLMDNVPLYQQIEDQTTGYEKGMWKGQRTKVEGTIDQLVTDLRMDPKGRTAVDALPPERKKRFDEWGKPNDPIQKAQVELGGVAQDVKKEPRKVFDYIDKWNAAEKLKPDQQPEQWYRHKEDLVRDARFDDKAKWTDDERTRLDKEWDTAKYQRSKASLRELDARGGDDRSKAYARDVIAKYEGRIPDQRYTFERGDLQKERDGLQKQIDDLTARQAKTGTPGKDGRELTDYEKRLAKDDADRLAELKKKREGVDGKLDNLDKDQRGLVQDMYKERFEKDKEVRAKEQKKLDDDLAAKKTALEEAKKNPEKKAEAEKLQKEIDGLEQKKTKAETADEDAVRKMRFDAYDRTVEPMWAKANELKTKLAGLNTDEITRKMDDTSKLIKDDERYLGDLEKRLKGIRDNTQDLYVGGKKVSDRNYEVETIDRIDTIQKSLADNRNKVEELQRAYLKGEVDRTQVQAELDRQYLKIKEAEREVEKLGAKPVDVNRLLRSNNPDDIKKAYGEIMRQREDDRAWSTRKNITKDYEAAAAAAKRRFDELPPLQKHEAPPKLKPETPEVDRLEGSPPPTGGKAQPPATIYRGGGGGREAPVEKKDEKFEAELRRAGEMGPKPQREVIPADLSKLPPPPKTEPVAPPANTTKVELSEETTKTLQRQAKEMTELGRQVFEDFAKFGKKLGLGGDNGPIQQKVVDLKAQPPAGPDYGKGGTVKLDPTVEKSLMIAERLGYGFDKGVLETMHGLSKLITQPEEIVKGLGEIAKNPGKAGNEIWKSIKDAWEKDPVEFVGRAGFEVLSLFAGPSGKAGAVNKAAKIGGTFDDAARILTKDLGVMEKSLAKGQNLTKYADDLAVQLEKQGLTKESARALADKTTREAIERTTARELAEQQAKATTHLTQDQATKVAREFAEKAGLKGDDAARFAEQLAKERGFMDWVRGKLPEKYWTPEMHREHLLSTASPNAAKELGKLGLDDLAKIYPEKGPIPYHLDGVAKVEGFADFAKANPAAARTLADANGALGNIPGRLQWHVDDAVQKAQAAGKTTPAELAAARKAGFEAAAKELETVMPQVKAHAGDPRYNIVQRSPSSPDWMPEINLRPTRELDHNGAFMQPAKLDKGKWARANVADIGVMEPGQLIVNGKPLANMDGVMVFSGHGGRGSFQGLSTKDAAKMVAEQVAEAQKTGKTIDKCVLDACHQRDRRWFMGSSNAQAFQKELSAELQRLGVKHDVKVLAADKGGPLYGSSTKSYFGNKFTPAQYTPATDGARFYMSKMEAAVGVGLTAEAAVGGYYLYRALTDE